MSVLVRPTHKYLTFITGMSMLNFHYFGSGDRPLNDCMP